MQIISSIQDFKKARREARGLVGFVPTMGYLHEGHMSLVRRAKAETQTVVASIFVNPTQFGPQEDYAQYPRDPERDLAMLEKEGVDIVFMPTPEEIYPPGFNTWVEVIGVTERLEGAHRPGHFRGVATVVAKLFNIVEPHKSYFGQKDGQQVMVIKKMVRELNMPVDVIVCPTVREPDGLAMSSRNVYLNPQERQSALVLWKSLQLAQELYTGGEKDASAIRRQMETLIQAEPLTQIEYVSIAHSESLEELKRVEGVAMVSLAVRFGKTRLIDNLLLGE